MFNTTTFYSVLTPMYYATKLCGLTPFKITGKFFENSKFHLLWSISCALFLSFFTFASIKATGVGNEIIAEVTNILDVYLGIAQMSFGILFGCIFRNDILKVLQQIKVFDEHMQIFLHIDLEKKYRKSKIYLVVWLSIVMCWSVISFAYIAYVNRHYFTLKTFGRFLSDTFPYLISTLIELQFCTLLFCLRQRFRWLNNKIIEISNSLEKRLQICKNQGHLSTHLISTLFIQDRTLYFIEKIRASHYQLCSFSQTINKAYSMQVLLTVLQTFITIIVALYYTGKVIVTDKIFPAGFLAYGAVLVAGAIVQLLVLVSTCGTTAAEAQKTGVLIHRIKILHRQREDDCTEPLRLEIAFFSFQLLHHNVQFTACEMFVIDETLILRITEAVTAYLVIVLQFEVGD